MYSAMGNLLPASNIISLGMYAPTRTPATFANLTAPTPNPIPVGWFLQSHSISPQQWQNNQAAKGYPDYGWDLEANSDGSMSVTLTPPLNGIVSYGFGMPGKPIPLNLSPLHFTVTTSQMDNYSIGMPWVINDNGLVPGAPAMQQSLPTLNKNYPWNPNNPMNFIIWIAWSYAPYTAPVRSIVNREQTAANVFVEQYTQQQNSKGFFNHFNNFMKKAIPVATAAMFAYAGGAAIASAAQGTEAANVVNTMETAAHSVYGEAVSAAHDVSQVVGALKSSISTGIGKVASDVIPKSLQTDALNYIKKGAVSKAVSSITQFAVKAYDQNRINKAQQQAALQAAASLGTNPPSSAQTTFQGAVNQSVTQASGMPAWLGPAALIVVGILSKVL